MLRNWLALHHCLGIPDIGEEHRYDVLAVSTPLVGTTALGASHAALVQLDRDIVGGKFAAFDLSAEGFSTLNQIGDGPAVKIFLATLKGIGRRQGLNDSFSELSFRHDS